MADRDEQFTADGTWRATMTAFKLNFFFYKAIGTSIVVHHKEQRRSGLFGWWGPFVDTWIERPADGIRIINTYAGPTARQAEALGLGECSARQQQSLDCRLWAVGIGVSVTYDAPLGGFPPNPTPTPGATILDVRAVRGIGMVGVAGESLSLVVDAGPFPPGSQGSGLSGEPTRLGFGSRISCVDVSGNGRITAVGGVGEDGSAWRLSLGAAVAAVEAGLSFYVERPEGDRVAVIVAVSAKGRRYLKTEADGDVPNNLLALPSC